MAITIDLGRAEPKDLSVVVSPLSELISALHVLAEPEHHPEARRWIQKTTPNLSNEFIRTMVSFAPLWARYRCRIFYPLLPRLPLTLEAELALLQDLDPSAFADMAAKGIYGNDVDAPDGSCLTDERSRRSFIDACTRRSFARGELAATFVADPEAFRVSLIDFLRLCGHAFFTEWWQHSVLAIEESAQRLRGSLGPRSLPEAVASVSSTSELRSPTTVRFDKLQNGEAMIGPRALILVPTVRSWPHLTVKLESPWAVIVHFAIAAPGAPLTLRQLHDRLAVLASPQRMEVCRHLLGEPTTTSELAARMSQSTPQISRALAPLKEAGLVVSERKGKHIYHRLVSDAILRLGQDILATITR